MWQTRISLSRALWTLQFILQWALSIALGSHASLQAKHGNIVDHMIIWMNFKLTCAWKIRVLPFTKPRSLPPKWRINMLGGEPVLPSTAVARAQATSNLCGPSSPLWPTDLKNLWAHQGNVWLGELPKWSFCVHRWGSFASYGEHQHLRRNYNEKESQQLIDSPWDTYRNSKQREHYLPTLWIAGSKYSMVAPMEAAPILNEWVLNLIPVNPKFPKACFVTTQNWLWLIGSCPDSGKAIYAPELQVWSQGPN